MNTKLTMVSIRTKREGVITRFVHLPVQEVERMGQPDIKVRVDSTTINDMFPKSIGRGATYSFG
jgi:hypothetical protein